jgi:glycosyltransferase involved in cell wall biosynthesis
MTNPPLPLAAVIITLNEETNLPRCLSSVRGLASEIVVVDSGSTDRTREIAEASGARFVFRQWEGYVPQKNAALAIATQEWALCLDADEEVTPELAVAIRRVCAGGDRGHDGYFVNRLNYYLGDWIRHAWHPEWRLRLVRRACARWQGDNPHDRLATNGRTDRLDGYLHHYSYVGLRDHFARILRYASIAAEARLQSGRPVRWYHLACSPWAAFFKALVLKQAWRDGWRGWVIAFTTLIKVFAKYALVFESRRSGEQRR